MMCHVTVLKLLLSTMWWILLHVEKKFHQAKLCDEGSI